MIYSRSNISNKLVHLKYKHSHRKERHRRSVSPFRIDHILEFLERHLTVCVQPESMKISNINVRINTDVKTYNPALWLGIEPVTYKCISVLNDSKVFQFSIFLRVLKVLKVLSQISNGRCIISHSSRYDLLTFYQLNNQLQLEQRHKARVGASYESLAYTGITYQELWLKALRRFQNQIKSIGLKSTGIWLCLHPNYKGRLFPNQQSDILCRLITEKGRRTEQGPLRC